MKILVFLLLWFILPESKALECNKRQILKSFKPSHAKFFKIDYYDNYKIVTSDKVEYLLANNVENLNCKFELKIHIPVKRVGLTSTTYLPTLELLSEENSLVAFQGKKYIYSEKFNKKNIRDIGYDLNLEYLISLKLDVVLAYSENISNNNKLAIFYRFKTPVVLNYDQYETSPLGRAEWIIFNSSFFNKEEEAILLFNQIVTNYKNVKNQSSSQKKKNVLIGEIKNGKWALPGGQSDLAILIKDAGGNLVIDRPSRQTQYISMEEMLQKYKNIDLWLTHNNWISSKDFLTNSSYKSYINKYMYNYNNRVNEFEANDFWEMGLQRPDLLLKDIKMMLSDNVNVQSLKWYRKL